MMLKCAHCEKLFKYESERKRHQESHVPKFECTVCANKFSFLSALRRHQKQHERKGSVQCDECKGNFRDSTLLKRHKQYAHTGCYRCVECSATFSSEQALRTHAKIHNPESERQYRCTFTGCKKTFNFPHHLKHHELTHTNTKQHFCNVCQKGFIQSHHLKTHLKTHHPENSSPCADLRCKKKVVTKSAGRKQTSTHSKCEDVNFTEIKFDSGISSDSNPPNDTNERSDAGGNVPCVTCGKFILRINYLKHTLNCTAGPKVNDARSASLNHDGNLEPRSSLNSTYQVTSGAVATKVKSNIKCEAGCTYRCDNPDHNNDVLTGTKGTSSANCEAAAAACAGCTCGAHGIHDPSSLASKQLKTGKIKNMPELEYRKDGVIKLKETFDADIIVVKQLPESVIIVDKTENDMKNVPFNSCKAVLGKCIVSEDGSVGESCLCAKMLVDEQQMSAQEIDELTPNPNTFW